MQGRFGIGWVIAYIHGRQGFHDDVLPKLRDHYITGNSEGDNLMMVWLPDINKLRSLKWAVGSKSILKYRLHFFASVNPRPGKPRKHAKTFAINEGEKGNPMVVW
jgi:hypothetical protein